MTEVSAKVANVLDSSRLALAVGSDQGVEVGDAVRLWREVEVIDPDSKESLGTVRLVKARLSVSEVQPRFCIAEVRTESWTSSILAPRRTLLTSQRISSASSGSNSVHVVVGEVVTIETSDDSGE